MKEISPRKNCEKHKTDFPKCLENCEKISKVNKI